MLTPAIDTPAAIAHRRLINQQIAQSQFHTPADIVRHLCAIQAQDYLGALWSIGLRIPGSTEASIEQAVAERAIVRTWPMRGTLHFVAPEDVRWMLALLTPRVIAKSARRLRQLKLDEATLHQSVEVLADALQGQSPRSRDELFETLEQHKISSEGQRGYHILWWAAQNGHICGGPRQGKTHTFVWLDDWLDDWVDNSHDYTGDDALAEIAVRYFTGHGPATVYDFAWWAGLTLTSSRKGISAAEARLVQHELDDEIYWTVPAAGELPAAVHETYLPPGFDEYMLGYTDRSPALAPHFANRIHPGGNGIFKPTVVIDGQVTGIWKRTLKKRSVTLEFTPFTRWTDTQQETIRGAAQRYADFVERTLNITFHTT